MTETTNPSSDFLLCPGQGAQFVGMGQAWHEASSAAREVFAQANGILGFDLTQLCFNGPDDELNRTDVAQAAIYTSSVACAAGLREQNGFDPSQCRGAAGLSLGEFTSLHLAGAYSFEEGLTLVRLRGQAMQEAADANPSTMVALTGDVEENKVVALCDEARGEGILVPANYNSPMQVVVSGSHDACERAAQLADKYGWRATPLTVAGAFHSPIMQPAAERLSQALQQVNWQPLNIPVISNVTGEPHDGQQPQTICDLLVQQLTSPVRWSQSMQWVLAQMPGPFVELAPGKVLSGLLRRIDRKASATQYNQPA